MRGSARDWCEDGEDEQQQRLARPPARRPHSLLSTCRCSSSPGRRALHRRRRRRPAPDIDLALDHRGQLPHCAPQMRSLTCLSSINAVLPPVSGGSGSPGSSASAAADRAASALAFNPESGVVYVATERGSTIDIFEVAGINTNQMQLVRFVDGPKRCFRPSKGGVSATERGASRLCLAPTCE